MSRLLLGLVLLAATLLAPAALAQPVGGVDATIVMTPDGPPVIEGTPGLARLVESEPGERYVFALTLVEPLTTFEFRMSGFDVERPRQMVPTLVVPDTEFPLFHAYPNERVWEAEGQARIANVSGTAEEIVLRLGVDGPRNHTLVITRDVTPPVFTLGEVVDLTHIGFYQETTTGEMALADLQVQKVGAAEPVVNPTPEYHIRQRFPIQGLDPSTEYDLRVVFTDWAGNRVASETYRITTPERPVVPLPIVEALFPAPNATLVDGVVIVRARVVADESPLADNGIRLFFDKKEITSGLVYENEELVFRPPALAPGRHSVAVEATNAAGGTGVARWSFEVGDETRSSVPLPALLALAALALAARRRGAA